MFIMERLMKLCVPYVPMNLNYQRDQRSNSDDSVILVEANIIFNQSF